MSPIVACIFIASGEPKYRKFLQFDTFGHILPPNVTREPIGPLTKRNQVVKVEQSSVIMAANGLRRQQFRATSEAYYSELQEKGKLMSIIFYAVKFIYRRQLDYHLCVCDRLRSRIVEASARSGCSLNCT